MKKLFLLSVILLLMLNSCSKKNNPVSPNTNSNLPEAPTGTAWETTTVNTKEIGGKNVAVISVYDTNAHKNNSKLETLVSQNGTQLVFAVDNNHQVRGLSYTIKKDTNYEIHPVDASSTINSLFLLVPGMSTTSSSETNELFNNLKTLSSYNSFTNYIKQNLHDKTINQILKDAQADTLFKRTIIDCFNKYKLKNGLQRVTNVKDIDSRFRINRLSAHSMKLSNYGFRMVNVYRCYENNNKISDTKEIVKNMAGVIPASWGSFFTLSTFNPTIEIDSTYSPASQYTITDYWVIGLGKATATSLPPPATVATNCDDATGKTLLYYCAFPVIDVLMGTNNLLNVKPDVLDKIWKGVKGLHSLDKLKEANNTTAVASETIDLVIGFLGDIMSESALYGSLGISASAAQAIGLIIGTGALAMAAGNGMLFALNVMSSPSYDEFLFTTRPDPPSLMSPKNAGINLPTSIKLSWNVNPVATSYMVQVSTDSLFTNSILKVNIGEKTSKQLSGLNYSKTYYWRVSDTNSDGTSDWSDIWHFTTMAQGSIPSVPSLLQPSDNATDVDTTLTLAWNASNGATSYSLQVSIDNSFSSFIYNQSGLTNTSEKISGLSNSTTYYWRVSATNNYGASNWTPTWSFTTKSIVEGDTGTFTDPRDGHVYKIIKIGNQWWFAENLDYATSGAFYYDGNEGTNKKYGRLYNLADANKACPSGWHIPSQQEWINLAVQFGGFDSAGAALKETGTINWDSPNTGATNESKFTALPGGWANYDVTSGVPVLRYHDLHTGARFWSSTTTSFQGYTVAKILRLSNTDNKAYYNDEMGVNLFFVSVRCVKD